MTGSKASRRKQKRAREKRAGARQRNSNTLDHLPRPLRLVVESHEQVSDYLSSAENREEAIELARTRFEGAVGSIVDMMAGHDPLDVLENVWMINSIGDPETYRETDHEGMAAAIEIIALIAGSQTAAERAAVPGSYDMAHQPPMDEIQAAAIAAMGHGSMLRLFETGMAGASMSGLSFALGQQEAYVRNTSYAHMARETLEALLSDPAVGAAVKQAVGATPQEMMAVIDAVEAVRPSNWNDRVESFAQTQTELGLAALDKLPTSDQMQEWHDAWSALFGNPSEVGVLDVGELSDASGVEQGKVGTILDMLATDVSSQTAVEASLSLVSGTNPFRKKPILRHSDGRLVAIHGSLLVHAIRPGLEDRIKDGPAWHAYDDARKRFSESLSIDYLSSMLPGAEIHRSIKYFVPDPAKSTETTPGAYTKLVEADGLIVIDDVALTVEVKAGAVDDRARAGSAGRLKGDLKSLIKSATEQANRTRSRILEDGSLRLRDGSTLDLSFVREVHSVVVTLEDLGGVLFVADELVAEGLLPVSEHPWMVSLHDLRIVSELVEQPCELLLYLRRRTHPEITRSYVAVDELDYFLYFFSKGLYVEPDPDRIAAADPDAKVTVADRRKFARQKPTMILSQTGPLDDWYYYNLGLRDTPAPKPKFSAPPQVLAICHSLTQLGSAGWLTTATELVSVDAKVQRWFLEKIRDLQAMVVRDLKPHMLTTPIGYGVREKFVLAWVVIPATFSSAARVELVAELERYISAKKYQMRAARAAVLVLDQSGLVQSLLFDGRVWEYDDSLAAAVVQQGLVDADDMQTKAQLTMLKRAASKNPAQQMQRRRRG